MRAEEGEVLRGREGGARAFVGVGVKCVEVRGVGRRKPHERWSLPIVYAPPGQAQAPPIAAPPTEANSRAPPPITLALPPPPQVFLNRVASHPVLKASRELQRFLESNEDEFALEVARASAVR